MATKYNQSLAVLLNDGSKQILPVSKANLIELVGNTYTNHFGNIANPDVDTALAYLAGTYIPNATQEAKDYALGLVNALDGGTISLTSKQAVTTISQADGQVSASTGNINAEYVDVAADYGTGNTTVETVLSYLKGQIDDARGDGEITVTRSIEDTSYAAVYTITQNSETKGTINIPKDMVATNGTLVDSRPRTTADGEGDGNIAGTYILMTIANGDPFYIDVKDLIEYNNFTDSTEIDFTDNNHTITAEIKTIASSKITYNNTTVEAELGTINGKINTLNGDVNTTGSVAKAVNDAVTGLNSTAATAYTDNGFTYVITGVEEANGLLTSTTYEALTDEKIKTVPFDSTSYLYQLLGAAEIATVDDVHDALNAIANRVKAAAGDGVTTIVGDTGNTYIDISASKSGNTVTLTIDESALGNVAKLQYDELDVTNVEAFGMYDLKS